MRSVLRPRLLKLSPAHLETPRSYLRRLCAANQTDGAWLTKQILDQRFHNAKTIIEAIEAYDGPAAEHWSRAHQYAIAGMPTGRGTPEAPASTRSACLSCTAGERVETYTHIRFTFCRKHGQWLGDGTRQQRHGVLDGRLWKAERVARTLVATGLVDQNLFQSSWSLVRDHRFLIDPRSWDQKMQQAHDRSEFIREVDDRLALFPETVRVMWTITRPGFAAALRAGTYDATIRRDWLNHALDRDA